MINSLAIIMYNGSLKLAPCTLVSFTSMQTYGPYPYDVHYIVQTLAILTSHNRHHFVHPLQSTVEPLNKGHIGTSHFVPIERSSSWWSKSVLLPWEMIILGHYELSFLEKVSSFRMVLYQRFHCNVYGNSSILSQ